MAESSGHKEEAGQMRNLSSEWRLSDLTDGRAIVWDVLPSSYLFVLFLLTLKFKIQ